MSLTYNIIMVACIYLLEKDIRGAMGEPPGADTEVQFLAFLLPLDIIFNVPNKQIAEKINCCS